MNDDDIIRIARQLETTNRNNKLTIQRRRARFARTKASIESLPKPDKFPTKYKYG